VVTCPIRFTVDLVLDSITDIWFMASVVPVTFKSNILPLLIVVHCFFVTLPIDKFHASCGIGLTTDPELYNASNSDRLILKITTKLVLFSVKLEGEDEHG